MFSRRSTNIGTADRVIRIVLGLVLLTSIFVFDGRFWWLGLLGFVPILTALVGWCPAYSLLGIDTSIYNGKNVQRI